MGHRDEVGGFWFISALFPLEAQIPRPCQTVEESRR